MAVTAPRIILAAFVLALAQAHADQAADARAKLEVIARGLSEGNPADAISPFDKSYPDYEKLSGYFGGLTNAFQIVNEIDVVDEQDTGTDTTLTVHWTITLSDLGSNYTERRASDLQVRLILKDLKWKIVQFAPIGIFDPKPKPWPKPAG